MRKIKNFANRLQNFVKKIRQWINFCDEIAKIKSICEIFSQNSVNDFCKIFYFACVARKIFFPGTCRENIILRSKIIFSFKILLLKIYFCLQKYIFSCNVGKNRPNGLLSPKARGDHLVYFIA